MRNMQKVSYGSVQSRSFSFTLTVAKLSNTKMSNLQKVSRLH